MPSYSKPEIVLVRYPFSDLTSAKVRPAVVVNAAHVSQDLFVVALTSKMSGLLAGEFVLAEWKKALNSFAFDKMNVKFCLSAAKSETTTSPGAWVSAQGRCFCIKRSYITSIR